MTHEINFLENRPENKLIEAFKKLSVSIISDAQGRYGCLDSSIKPLSASMSCIGPAFTVQTYRADNLMIHLAIEMAQPGDLLVIDACGFSETGLWGELMTIMAQKKELAGIVINGGVRDKMELIKSSFPVFSRSVCPMGGVKTSPGSINVPISCAGVSINPGDIVMGDANGVVAIPSKHTNSVLSHAQKIQTREKEIIEQMEQGKTLFNILELEKVILKSGKFNLEEYCSDNERLVSLILQQKS